MLAASVVTMNSIPYNPTRDALYRPAKATDFFAHQPYPNTAALCAELSRLAYYGKAGSINQSKLREYLNGVFDLRAVADIDGSQGFVVENDDMVVMAFRGTEGVRDVLSDLIFFPRPWVARGIPAGRVHRGFARALAHVLPALVAALPTQPKPLVLSGHSLGGAMATLAASQLPASGLYTFGEPRAGNAEFARFLDRQSEEGLTYHRYVDCCDLVTRVPPGFMGFKHAGELHYIDADGDLQRSPDKRAISADRSKARRDYWRHHALNRGNVWLRDLADHAPINYLSAMLGRRSSKVPVSSR